VQFRYVIGPNGSVDSSDRGLAYGDGLFETMAIRHGDIQRFHFHWDRLRAGCEQLLIPVPDQAELQGRMTPIVRTIEYGSLKLILTRGSGLRGYAPPDTPVPMLILTAADNIPKPAESISLATLQQRLAENATFAGIKHLCRLEQVMGQMELKKLSADEGLMLNTGGQIIGGTSRNLFAVCEKTVITPELSRSGISGVMRRSVLEACAELGIPFEERAILPAELPIADELFMTNALVGIQSVNRLDGRRMTTGPITRQLCDSLGQ